MRRTIVPLAVVLAVSVLVGACAIDHKANVLTPTDVVPSVTASYVGTWTSQAAVQGFPSPTACGNFQWRVTSQSATAISGEFSALCAGSLTVSGTASGQLNGSATASIAASGSASGPGLPSCAFSLTGTGYLEGNTIRIPYTGTTCLGPVSGTETLRRS